MTVEDSIDDRLSEPGRQSFGGKGRRLILYRTALLSVT
jgi:hypothetical protein